jgi:hypothetical protein
MLLRNYGNPGKQSISMLGSPQSRKVTADGDGSVGQVIVILEISASGRPASH